MSTNTDQFPTEVGGLGPSERPAIIDVPDGDSIDLRIAPVTKEIDGATVRMLAYNGSIPGPTLRVAEGSEIAVRVENQGDLEATVHWHGLRLDNRYDGTHETQRPLAIGESFEYRLTFPDPGIYWYHPHVRQDYGQELGLYGNIVVVPSDPNYWPPAHREVALTLDDILLADDEVAHFSRTETTYSAMGRFGNRMLVQGEPDFALTALEGEVVRLYLTNTANTRVFNAALRGGRMKLVGGDSGRCEHEQFVDSVVLAPSERVVVDVCFPKAGEAVLEHRTPEHTYVLASIAVGKEAIDPEPTQAFETLRTNPELVAERKRIEPYRDAEPDKTLAFVAEMDFEAPEGNVVFACPMHPEVVRTEEGSCPKCGMKLMPKAAAVVFTCPMHPEITSAVAGKCPECGMKLMPSLVVTEATTEHNAGAHHGDNDDGDDTAHAHASGAIEWEDDMVDVNRKTTPANTRWKLIDRATGAQNHAIDWKFRVGDRVKIRLVNEMDSDHPMHHPFHIHGAGRFLVLSRDGVEDPNLVWTDTVLVKTGEVLDILLDITHAGRWMAHCHIAEHHESGMMFSFDVAPNGGG